MAKRKRKRTQGHPRQQPDPSEDFMALLPPDFPEGPVKVRSMYVGAVRHMKLKVGSDETLPSFYDSLILESESTRLDSFMTEQVQRSLGLIALETLATAETLIFQDTERITELEDVSVFLNQANAVNEASLRGWTDPLQFFLTAAWCVKDHSISLNQLWGLQQIVENEFTVPGFISADDLHTLNSKGEAETTTWTKREIEAAQKYTLTLCGLFYQEDRIKLFNEEPELFKVRALAKKDGGSFKLENFFNIISHHVRPEGDLSFRITFMIQALEALLSTSKSELTYRLSLRVSLILGTSPSSRKRIFLTMKDAYGVRSTTIHGSTFKLRKIKSIAALAEELDGYCRAIGRKLFDDPDFLNLVEGNEDDLEETMLEGILKAGFDPPDIQSG